MRHAGIVPQGEIEEMLEVALSLAAPDEVHQSDGFRRSSIRVRSRLNTS
jgi:hypothetical protein